MPTLNEGDGIQQLINKIISLNLEERFGKDLEIIVVDDGSTDGTRQKVLAFQEGLKQERAWPGAVENVARPNISVRLIERNTRGLATAVLCGYANSSGDTLGVLDADFSHPIEIIPNLTAAVLGKEESGKDASGVDIAVGSRYVDGGGAEEWPFARRIYSLLATLIARPLSGKVKDPMSGFFFVKRRVVKKMLEEGGVKIKGPIGYKILLEILVKGDWKTSKEIPIIFKNRSAGKSKMGFKVATQYFLHLAQLYFWKLKTVFEKFFKKIFR